MKKGSSISQILRYLVPVAILAIVWYVTLPVLRYTLLMQEQKGIFLLSPDYFRQVFSDSWPITTLISDFLVQFYRIASLGALITGLIVSAEYILVSVLFRFSSFRQVIGGLAAAGIWYLIAKTSTPHPAIVVLVFSDLLAAISVFVPYQKIKFLGEGKSGSWQAAIAVAMIITSAALIVSDRKVREYERWYAVEYCSRSHDWDVVLAIATPQECRRDMSYTPYAMLALNAKGQLLDRFRDYPVSKKEDLGDLGDMSWRDYSLRSQIYEVIGGTNEAIHLCYQSGMSLPHGTSFGVLRQLIRLEIENGDYELARKHATVLARSPFNRKTAEAALSMANTSEKKAEEDKSLRLNDAMVSDNPVYNMSAIITNSPNATPAAKERLLCHLLIAGDMEAYNAIVGN